MFILTVKVRSALSHEEALAIMEQKAPEFRALPGLVQKYCEHEQTTGAYTGVYIWESEDAMRAYQQSELAKTIVAAYQATELPRIEVFDLIRMLHPAEAAATVS
jgi:quinol monooxygenase YgiN